MLQRYSKIWKIILVIQMILITSNICLFRTIFEVIASFLFSFIFV
jgi:hypothetical protein